MPIFLEQAYYLNVVGSGSTHLYVARSIPNDVFSVPIYNVKSIKPNYYRDAVACDSTKWEAYFIASWPGSVTYSFIFDCFIKYWDRYDILIDYFLFHI